MRQRFQGSCKVSAGTNLFHTLTVCCFRLIKSDITSEILHPALQKHLSPTGIIPIVESYTTAVQDLLEKEGSGFEGISTPLHDFVLPVLYQASAYAFFGRSFPAVESYKPFHDFDGSFHLLLAGAPRIFLRKHVNGLTAMHRLLEKYFDGPHDDASAVVSENEQVVRGYGYVCFSFEVYTGKIGLLMKYNRIRTPSGCSSPLSYSL